MRIDANARTIRQLLANTKHQLDYYQREYSWQTKHVTELLDDLSKKFLESYMKGDTLADVPKYKHYFLGSIIISHNEGQRYIVDGQQRLTTLTLLLISLCQSLDDGSLKDQVEQCIYSLSDGTEGFNLDASEWNLTDASKWYHTMETLYKGEAFDENDHSGFIQNIVLRYSDIEDYFEIQGESLLLFAYWLLYNVYLVEIEAFDSKDAYAIFETVNDRGLSLTPTEMLGGYLLSSIKEIEHRDQASEVWRKRIETLKQIGKGEESEAIKAWLRSQYAQSISDFDVMGSEFHRWVQDQEKDLQLKQSQNFENFIKRDFEFYTDWYCRLRRAANSFTDAVEDGLECVFYNAQHSKFTLQYPILLAPLRENDSDTEKLQKVKIVASYLDILIYRRIWNLLSIAQNTMANLLPPVIPIIRGKSCNELRDILHAWIQEKTPPFVDNDTFGLHGRNRRKITLILARMTDYVGIQSGESSQYRDYMRTGNDPYEIEHIWANNFEHHADEFSHESEFEAYRERIGGLLLLPKSVNASSGDDPYNEKRKVYAGQNLLAQTLTEQAYKNRPGFKRFKDNSGLPFRKHPEFKKADLDARQELYLGLAEQIWSSERLRTLQGAEPEIKSGPESSPRNLGEDNEDEVRNIQVSHNEDSKVEVPDLEDEDISADSEKVSEIELIKDKIQESYKTESNATIRGFCTRISELLNFIEEKGWTELTFKTRKLYCGFYIGKHPVFGVFLSKNLPFVVWMDEEDAEKLKDHYEFKYERSRRHVYFQHIRIEELRPILESVYNKCRED